MLQFLFFILIFTLIGFVFTLASKTFTDYEFVLLLKENCITANSVGIFTFLFAHLYNQKIKEENLKTKLLKVVSFSLLGGLFGRVVSLILHHIILERIISFNQLLFATTLSTTLVSFLISSSSVTIWHFLDIEINSKKDKVSVKLVPEIKTIEVKIKNKISFLNIENLVYLTSNGKKTILHTKTKDFELNEILKNVLAKLPKEKFIRVHKKHAINLDYFESMEHLSSGDYQAYLFHDNFIVPISAKNKNLLKEKISSR